MRPPGSNSLRQSGQCGPHVDRETCPDFAVRAGAPRHYEIATTLVGLHNAARTRRLIDCFNDVLIRHPFPSCAESCFPSGAHLPEGCARAINSSSRAGSQRPASFCSSRSGVVRGRVGGRLRISLSDGQDRRRERASIGPNPCAFFKRFLRLGATRNESQLAVGDTDEVCRGGTPAPI
ncbi:hypothetical protein P3T24_001664 [Paraburkholderia sp. GAS33]|jgi:hypothetical protein